MSRNINSLLEREVTRREFLQIMAGGIAVIFGVHNLISYIMSFNHDKKASEAVGTSHGFGSRSFGA